MKSIHGLLVKIERMTPEELDDGGKSLSINYSFSESPFGKLIVASTCKGVCQMFFDESEEKAFIELKSRFPNAQYQKLSDKFQYSALKVFQKEWKQSNEVKLHLKGTGFQLKVWDALLKIPMGELTTYGSIAAEIGKPKASRAVGTAIGANSVALLVPCHRVIQASGNIGGYMWGVNRKSAIIAWEASKKDA